MYTFGSAVPTLTPLLSNPQTDWSYPALLTNTGRKYGSDTNMIPTGKDAYHGAAPWYVMLREGRYKYVRPLIPNDLEELYDLREDPEELDNLAVKPEHAQRLKQMRTAAIAELQRNHAGFVNRMPTVRRAP